MTEKVRVHIPPIEFGSPEEALEWFDWLVNTDSLPTGFELYEPDAIDKRRSPLTSRDLIVRQEGDRPFGRVRERLRPRRGAGRRPARAAGAPSRLGGAAPAD